MWKTWLKLILKKMSDIQKDVENLAGFSSRKWSSNGGHRRVTQQATKSVIAKSQYKERSRWTKDILMSCHQEIKTYTHVDMRCNQANESLNNDNGDVWPIDR